MPSETRRRFLHHAAAAAWLGVPDGNAVRCTVVDAETRRPVPARIRLTDAQGNEVVPIGHPAELDPKAQQGDVLFQSRRFAYVDGSFSVDPRTLPLRYQAVRGYEYLIAEGSITGPTTIALSRWSSLARRGWYSGDVHIHHISPKTCRLEMDAEDLNIANILTSDFTKDQHEFEGGINRYSGGERVVYVNQEFRNDHLGHMCLLNLKRLVEPVTTMQPVHYPLNMRACDEAHRQGGYVSWAHFPSWPGVECPLDVALEKLDGLEILSVLDPREFPVFMRQVVPELEANDGLRLWYRFLNCGFRLTATAGTDKMTTFVTVGANRVFARLEGEFTYQNWIAALRAGRTFVTNSPVLEFTVNGREPGATLDFARAGKVEIRAAAESQIPYDRLEIVANGNVIAQASPTGARHRAEIRIEHPVTGSCWLAARVLEDLDVYRQRGVNFSRAHVPFGTRVSDYFGTRRPETTFAHSSPVYVIVDGKPIRNWEDASYYVRYLDNSIRWLETEAKFARPSDKKASIEAFKQGRAVFAARAALR